MKSLRDIKREWLYHILSETTTAGVHVYILTTPTEQEKGMEIMSSTVSKFYSRFRLVVEVDIKFWICKPFKVMVSLGRD